MVSILRREIVSVVSDLNVAGVTTFDFNVYLNAGQKIDFGVSAAGNHGSDSTLLDANISSVPVPGALVVFGLGMLGKMRRCRSL